MTIKLKLRKNKYITKRSSNAIANQGHVRRGYRLRKNFRPNPGLRRRTIR